MLNTKNYQNLHAFGHWISCEQCVVGWFGFSQRIRIIPDKPSNTNGYNNQSTRILLLTWCWVLEYSSYTGTRFVKPSAPAFCRDISCAPCARTAASSASRWALLVSSGGIRSSGDPNWKWETVHDTPWSLAKCLPRKMSVRDMEGHGEVEG